MGVCCKVLLGQIINLNGSLNLPLFQHHTRVQLGLLTQVPTPVLLNQILGILKYRIGRKGKEGEKTKNPKTGFGAELGLYAGKTYFKKLIGSLGLICTHCYI